MNDGKTGRFVEPDAVVDYVRGVEVQRVTMTALMSKTWPTRDGKPVIPIPSIFFPTKR